MPSRSRWLVGSSISISSGAPHQGLRDRQPLAPAAGERRGGRRRVGEPAPAEGRLDARRARRLVERGVVERGLEHRRDGPGAGRRRMLRDVGEPRQAAQRHRSGVGGLEAGEDPQQRGLAAAVGPHQADAIALVHPERELGEQRRGAERLGDRLTTEQQRHLGALACGVRRVHAGGRRRRPWRRAVAAIRGRLLDGRQPPRSPRSRQDAIRRRNSTAPRPVPSERRRQIFLA